MAGSLIYDSTLIQLLPSRSRRHDQMLYQDSPNLAAAPHHHHIDRRSSTPHQRLPPHPNDQPRSRSERSRKALSIPVRNSPSTNPNYFRSPHPGDIGPLSQQHQPGLPWVHDEIIAEFSPRDQLALDHVIANNIRRPLPAQNPLPPRLKQPNPRQPRSRNWRSNDAESLPPRFRSPHSTPGPRVPSPPFNPPWNRPPHAHLSRVDVSNNLAVLSNLPPQHLSSFLQSNVSYRPQQIIDTRRAQESKRIDISLNAKTLAPIGAERAQLLASNPRLSVVNDCTPHNSRHSLPYSYDPLLQTLRPSHHLSTRTPQFVPTGPSQLEKLYNRLKRSPNVSRILSPLNPIRNPESLVPSDAKWYKDERETRKRRILTSLDTSAFARRAIDRRSRTECEEFMPGLDVSDHCHRCRQDSLCKRLLVHRAREMLRSTSTSPISSEGALSSDEEDEIPNTPVDPLVLAMGKALELKTGITVADIYSLAGGEDAITLPSTVELMA